MKFVDEQGEGASPTLSALRAYRKHRAAGRRGVPPDAPLDFAPAAPATSPLMARRTSAGSRNSSLPSAQSNRPGGSGRFRPRRRGRLPLMFDTLAVARQLAAAGGDRDQAEVHRWMKSSCGQRRWTISNHRRLALCGRAAWGRFWFVSLARAVAHLPLDRAAWRARPIEAAFTTVEFGGEGGWLKRDS